VNRNPSWDTVDPDNGRPRSGVEADRTDAAPPGTAIRLSLWWNQFSPGGANSNAMFHPSLVEVAVSDSAKRDARV
jgi:hypothetical protein